MEKILADEAILNWIKIIDDKTKYTMSVVGGTLLLANAGLLKNKKAASHWHHQKRLEQFGAEYTYQNLV